MKTLGESLLSANFPFSMVWEEEMERGRGGRRRGGIIRRVEGENVAKRGREEGERESKIKGKRKGRYWSIYNWSQ